MKTIEIKVSEIIERTLTLTLPAYRKSKSVDLFYFKIMNVDECIQVAHSSTFCSVQVVTSQVAIDHNTCESSQQDFNDHFDAVIKRLKTLKEN